MVALRSRRLESLFGSRLDALTPAHVRSLVTSGVQEAFDLDFKLTLYGRTDSDKRALAGDVAALANTSGGIILLGVDEDDQARATNAPGVVLSDAEAARMRQIVASLVAPIPVFDILMVSESGADADDAAGDGEMAEADGEAEETGQGFFAIAVPRSPNAPHAVLINDALRYPKRNGATTRYLSEPEVAGAYRDRAVSGQGQSVRIEEIEREATERLAVRESPWLVVSLVPDLPGELILGYEALRAFEHEVRAEHPTILYQGVSISRVRVGTRRLLAHGTRGNSPMAEYISLELHTDGSGVFAVHLQDLARQRMPQLPDDEPRPQLVADEAIALGIMSGLYRLGQHARDRAAAGGGALVRAQLFPVTAERPTGIGHVRFYGIGEPRSDYPLEVAASPAEASGSLDDLAEAGPGLIATAAILLDEVGHSFGVPEMGQLSRDGKVRRRYWSRPTQTHISEWAESYGIEVTDETLQ
ncbi:helix-turn-helix domain-containing protein [Micromonospora parva]|uniref:helix-turn-helix domain-containing protein n=1 Tax=Micromonospora parva TaxID=1464048 RepID=UPI0037A62A0E